MSSLNSTCRLYDACVRGGCAHRNYWQPKASECGYEFRECADRCRIREDVVVARGTEGFILKGLEINARLGLTLRLLAPPGIWPSVPGHHALPATDAAGSTTTLKFGANRMRHAMNFMAVPARTQAG